LNNRKKDRIRCPFWRRRAVDLLEVVLSGARFLASRHKSLDVTPVKPTGNKRLVRCSRCVSISASSCC
jgi:hypothetical protein